MIATARRFTPFALIAALTIGSGGCIYSAMLKPKAEKIVTVAGTKAETLAQLSEAFKEIGLQSVSVNEKAGYVGGSRGWGYTESTFVEGRTIGDAPPLQVRVQVKSSGNGQELLDQIMAAFAKRAKTS